VESKKIETEYCGKQSFSAAGIGPAKRCRDIFEAVFFSGWLVRFANQQISVRGVCNII
jgi:hypothetical protein